MVAWRWVSNYHFFTFSLVQEKKLLNLNIFMSLWLAETSTERTVLYMITTSSMNLKFIFLQEQYAYD